ncbi:MAG: transcription antitermination factor NusB [Alphaproteobacteria bacterium]|nr:transcription antitermination factor NusB [Alphaproteobacteria bacterium]
MSGSPTSFAASAPELASSRRAARLCAVQALYQIVVSGADPTAVLKDFVAGRQGRITLLDGPDGSTEVSVDLPEPDTELLVDVVRCALDRADEVRSIMTGSLSQSWPIERLETLVDCVLRAGVAELLCRTDIPPKVTVSEGVEVAKAFYEGPEPGMVNAVLDKAARALGRFDDVSAARPASGHG